MPENITGKIVSHCPLGMQLFPPDAPYIEAEIKHYPAHHQAYGACFSVAVSPRLKIIVPSIEDAERYADILKAGSKIPSYRMVAGIDQTNRVYYSITIEPICAGVCWTIVRSDTIFFNVFELLSNAHWGEIEETIKERSDAAG